jgi:phosphonate transport system substrate-binding protein
LSRAYARNVGGCIVAGLLLCPLAWAGVQGAASKPLTSASSVKVLTFGFLPVESPVALFKRFAPLRDYLSVQLQQKIRMETAKNFAEFVRRTEQRQYDIVFTAPHMALHALDSKKYEVAATFAKPLKAVIVARKNSPIQNLAGLEGKTIATPPARAIVTLVGKKFLKTKGLPGIRFQSRQTHNAAYSAVLGREADAAILSNFIAVKAIANNLPLKIVAQSDPFPGIGILVARDLQKSTRRHIRTSLWGMSELPHGKKILTTITQPGYVNATKQQFEVLRPYVDAALP